MIEAVEKAIAKTVTPTATRLPPAYARTARRDNLVVPIALT